jgi:transcriptional regulator with XRE-family HTH domain
MQALPPPEASLLHRTRESAGITITEAARAAGITDTRWSQIERGHERRKGIDVPARAKAGTLARMARAIGISPERIESDGERPDAAEILREMLRAPEPAPPQAAVPGSPPPSAPGGDEYAEVIFMLLEEYPSKKWWDLFGASWRLQEHGSLPLLREALLTRRRAAEAPEDNGVRDDPAS